MVGVERIITMSITITIVSIIMITCLETPMFPGELKIERARRRAWKGQASRG